MKRDENACVLILETELEQKAAAAIGVPMDGVRRTGAGKLIAPAESVALLARWYAMTYRALRWLEGDTDWLAGTDVEKKYPDLLEIKEGEICQPGLNGQMKPGTQ